jgi:putative transcriptional regulator
MAKHLSRAARDALAATDWHKIDAMTDEDIARQIASNPDAAPDMAPDIDVRAIRRATGMTQVQFAATYEFSVRTVQEWERGAKRPSGPARTLLRAIKGDPEGLRRALAAA